MTSTFQANPENQDQTLIRALRGWMPEHSWGRLRKLIRSRRVLLNETLCLDEARRLRDGETIEIADRPKPELPQAHEIEIRFLDRQVVVVEKPAGLATVRHVQERDWPAQRKRLQPTFDEIVARMLHGRGSRGRRVKKQPLSRLRVVQRLDRDTSGLLVFARTEDASYSLIEQFRQHTVTRSYIAVVHGRVASQTLETYLTRDRGDGLRGSARAKQFGKRAVTHVELLERLGDYSIIKCQLETGRTHQIRIHLAEKGHMLCGEKVYRYPLGGKPWVDRSGAERQALHAAELGFQHPVTNERLSFTSELPSDLEALVRRLRKPI